MKKTATKKRNIDMRAVSAKVLAVYIICIVLFYFLAGDQLLFRDSRGNMELPAAQAGAAELSTGVVIEQEFSPQIQRFESVSVQIGTAYRPNAGTVTLEVIDSRDNTVLMQSRHDASAIEEGDLITAQAEQPLENVYNAPLRIRLTADSVPGMAVTPLVTDELLQEGSRLLVNGELHPGTLCFTASGQDYIWIGLHYWKFAVLGGLLCAALGALECYLQKSGKHSYLLSAMQAVKKYNFLIRQLVSRDFKTKYKRSVLGVFWSFLNPLLMMCVQYFVFSTIFKADIPNYPVYLLIGIVSFNFFSESCGMSLMSILGNAGLITKVYMPKYIYPLTRTFSSGINLLISLLPLIIVSLITGVQFRPAALLALYFLLCLVIFSLGLGLILSASMVFFRDTQFLWNVFSMIWMYGTPIFYPESILPEQFRFVLQVNPLYYFLKNMRICILDGISPEPVAYLQCMLFAVGLLLLGTFVFRKTQDKFVLYL